MMDKLAPRGISHRLAEQLADRHADEQAAEAFAFASMSAATRLAYGRQWRAFLEWAIASSDDPLPAEPATVAAYLASLARSGASFSRIGIARAAIAAAHREQGHPSPTHHPSVVKVLRGIGRELGTAQTPKRALTHEQLFAMADVDFGSPHRNLRNRALLLLAFAMPLRRSELAALRCSDLEAVDDGINVTIRRSKTNQLGRRDVRGVPRLLDRSACPCVAVQAWIAAAKLAGDVPLWPVLHGDAISRKRRLGGYAVARIVKAALRAIGVDATDYSAHSLRRGSLTNAARNGADLGAMMRNAGHKDPKTTMRYVEEGRRMGADNAARYAMGEKKRRET